MAVHISVHQRIMCARRVMRHRRHVAAQEHRHRAQIVIRILLFDNFFDLDFGSIVREGAAQANANAADAVIEQALDRVENILRRFSGSPMTLSSPPVHR